MREYNLPGFAIALIDDQDVIWQQAFGLANIEERTPMTLDTTLKVGSIAKVLTAIEIMRMYEEGLLDLDAPITDHLPDFSIRTRFPRSPPLTIRSLLAHRSGLPRNGTLPSWYWDPGWEVLVDQMKSLRETYTAFPPGYRYKYSNMAYVLLGLVIERVRGDFPIYMADSLLDPIGMTDSAFLSQEIAGDGDVATGYAYVEGENRPLTQYDIIGMPSANLYSTIGDMSELARFIFRGGISDGNRIIRNETLGLMFQPQYFRPGDPQGNGLGWFVDTKALSEKVVFHSGTIQGTVSYLGLIPARKLGVVFGANSSAFGDLAPELMTEALQLMLRDRRGITPLSSFLGKYIVDGEVVVVSIHRRKLTALFQGRRVSLIPLRKWAYKMEHWWVDIGDLSVEFLPANGGDEIIMILTVAGSYHITCPKYPEVKTVPPIWEKLEGEYKTHTRIRSAYSDADVLGDMAIEIVDKVLLAPELKAALWPISSREILIVGGAFDGETMVYEEETGNLFWQDVIYRPSG